MKKISTYAVSRVSIFSNSIILYIYFQCRFQFIFKSSCDELMDNNNLSKSESLGGMAESTKFFKTLYSTETLLWSLLLSV